MTLPLSPARRLALLRVAVGIDPGLIVTESGLDPDEWQACVLRSRSKQIALLGARQGAGKSSTAALLSTAELLAPNHAVIVGGPSEEQSKKVVAKTIRAIRGLGLVPSLFEDRELNATMIRSKHGSTMRALSSNEKTGRGETAHLLIVTEAARAADDLIDALTPALGVTHGRLLLESTPWFQRGMFWRVCDGQLDGWEVFRRPAPDCPRLSEEFLRGERAKGKMYYEREFLCQFHTPDDSFFDAGLISAAFIDIPTLSPQRNTEDATLLTDGDDPRPDAFIDAPPLREC